MTTGTLTVRHLFSGGWASDFGPSTDVVPDESGLVRIPYLLNADDCVFELDGGIRKAPGTSKLNSSALESGAAVKGIFDAWFSGSSGTSAQHRIIHISTKIKKDDADGTFSDLFTGLTSGAVPSYAMLEDLLVMANDVDGDVPKSWDASTAQNLAGSPPSFSFAATHKNRMWAAGVAANPSRLNYCALLDPADWTGSGSGSIDIDPNDGDRITGLISHKNELWIFKGPYKGSIHRITGSAPTGSDAFARTTFVKGVGAVGHNSIFRFADDVGFIWADGTIHSLKATSAFGDFTEAALSRPINGWIREHVNFARLKHAWAANSVDFGYVLFSLPIDSSNDPNIVIGMDYRFENVRWFKWPSYDDEAVSIASIVDSAASNRPIIMGGGSDGFVRKFGQATRSIDGVTALSYKWTTPHLSYGQPIVMKTLFDGSLGIQPKNNGDITFGWTRDDNVQQTESVAQGGTDVLATADNDQFTLGTSILAGARFVDRFFDLTEGGEFRSISFEASNAANNEDVEIHGFSASIKQGAKSLEN